MQNILMIICLAMMVGFSLLAIIWHSLLKATIALTITSILLAIVLFMLGLPLAGIFQLSIGAGLITVVFFSAISLTNSDYSDQKQSSVVSRKRSSLGPLLLIFGGLVIIMMVALGHFQLDLDAVQPVNFEQFRELFWQTRQTDILGQIIIILAGAFAVVALFKDQKNGSNNLLEDDSEG